MNDMIADQILPRAHAASAAVAIVVNHASGSCDGFDVATVEATLRRAGFEPAVTLAGDAEAIVQAVRDALADGVRIIVAGGGDGTLNAVASLLVGTDAALGVLPLGTLNHFAKDLGIPLAPDAAMQVVIDGHRRAVDIAEVNGKFFLNNSSVGIYPDMVRERESQQRRFGKSKWVAFFWACLRTAHRYPFLDVKLDADGDSLRRSTPFVFVGNNAYTIDGFDMGGRKSLAGGQLSLYVAQRTSRLGLLGFAVRALFGRLRQARDFDALLCHDVTVQTRRQRIRVSTDGEVEMAESPLRYRIRPEALTVFVPVPVERDMD